MKVIEVGNPKECRELIKKIPTQNQVGELISEDCLVKKDGKTIISYKILSDSLTKKMRFVAENVKIQTNKRSRGLPQKSAVFGPIPRKPNMAQDYCRFSKATYEQKQYLPAINEYNEFLCSVYKNEFPEIYLKAEALTKETINKDWLWLNGPYTNCNFNVNQAIPYHFDSANAHGGLSNVLILKKNIAGGELVCPEYGITFSQQDNAFIMFDGQSILHGVMPISQTKPEGYRASIVFYTLAALGNCLCKAEELEHAKNSVHKKTSRTNTERIELLGKYRGKL